MKRKFTIIGIVYGIFAFSFLFFVMLENGIFVQLAREDGLLETAGAGLFFLSSLAFLFLYLNPGNGQNIFLGKLRKRNFFFGLFAVLFFVCFGEEISWGQRIFGWQTPGFFIELNAQKELNIHNIWLFQGSNPDGSEKSFVELLLNMNRLFSIFWLGFCVIIPLANSCSKKANIFLKYLGIPIIPLWIGGIFIANYLAFRIVILLPFEKCVLSALDELKEINYALAFAVLAIYIVLKQCGRYGEIFDGQREQS